LIFYFSSGIIGPYTSDGPIFLWNAWHFKTAILSGELNLYTNDILYPHLSPLSLHTYTMFQSALVFLFDIIIDNIILSFNAVFLILNVAAAYFAYKFFALHIKSKLVAILAGEFFAFQALWSIYIIFGTQNFLGLWYIPAVLYFFELYKRKTKARHAILCGFSLAAAFINGFYPFIFAATGLIIYIVLCFVWDKKFINNFVKFLSFFIVSFVVFSVWKLFIILQQLDFIKSIPPTSIVDIDKIYHADPMNLIRPVQFHSIWGNWHNWFRDVSIENGNAFVGFSFLLVLILFALIKFFKKTKFTKHKRIYFFGVAYTLVVLLSFGPFLHFFGIETGIPMPHYIVQKIFPFYNSLRFPARWLILAQIFLAGIFALILDYVFTNINKKLKVFLFILISAGLVLDVFYLPRQITQITKTPSSKAYEEIAKNSNEGTVLYLPLSINSGYFAVGGSTKRPMAYQILHNQPIFGGHLSRLPFSYLEEYKDNVIIDYLSNYDKFIASDDYLLEKNINSFLNNYDIRYIVVDKSQIDLNTEKAINLKRYLINNLSFKEYYQDNYNEVFIFDK